MRRHRALIAGALALTLQGVGVAAVAQSGHENAGHGHGNPKSGGSNDELLVPAPTVILTEPATTITQTVTPDQLPPTTSTTVAAMPAPPAGSDVAAQAPAAGSTFDAPAPSGDGTALRTFLASVPDGVAGVPTIVRLSPGASYRITQQLTLTNRNHLWIDGQGATITSTDRALNRNVFSVEGGADIRLDHMTLIGRTDGTVQNGHGINLKGVQGFGSSGVVVPLVRDDGFRIGMASDAARTPSRNVVIENCQTLQTRRHSLSIVSAEGVTISGCLFDKTGTTSGTLIDIEPLGGDDVDGVLIAGNTFGYYPPSDARRSVQINGAPGSVTSDVTITGNFMRTLGLVINNNRWSVETASDITFSFNLGDPEVTVKQAVVRALHVDGLTVTENSAHLGAGVQWVSATDWTAVKNAENVAA